MQHVLQTNRRNYDKQSHEYRSLKLTFGEGLFTSDGEFWLRQRRLIQPAFHRKRINQLGENMVQDVLSRVESRQPYAERGSPLDIALEMVHLSMNVATKALFSTGLRNDAEIDTISGALDTIIAYCLYRTMTPPAPPLRVPTPRNRAFNEAMSTLNESAAGTTSKRSICA